METSSGRRGAFFVLETWGYRVLVAKTAVAALARVVDASLSLDLLFLQDPVPDRDELIRCAKEMQPDLRTLLAGDKPGYDAAAGADVFLPLDACTAPQPAHPIAGLSPTHTKPNKP